MIPIQEFAKEKFNIELTTNQLELIRAFAKGEVVHIARRAGWSTTKKIMLAYLEQSTHFQEGL